jgi:hypothetical protein
VSRRALQAHEPAGGRSAVYRRKLLYTHGQPMSISTKKRPPPRKLHPSHTEATSTLAILPHVHVGQPPTELRRHEPWVCLNAHHDES